MAEEKQKKEFPKKRPTAKKRMLQNEKKRLQNRSFKSKVRTAIRTLENSLSSEKKEDLSKRLNMIYSLMDKGVKNGIFKRNKAGRIKAKLATKCH